MTGRKRLWRYCGACGMSGGTGLRRERRKVCRNARCPRYLSPLDLGPIEKADEVRAQWRNRLLRAGLESHN